MSTSYLRRYTTIPELIYTLRERSITLHEPRSWDDRNDSYYLSLYRRKKGLKCMLALCFTQTREKYNHWRVFASGSSGVCIRFKRRHLLRVIQERKGVRVGDIRYIPLVKLKTQQLNVQDLPFVKRRGFEDEAEFRIIYESTSKEGSRLHIPIPLSCIDQVTLSPWIHPSLSDRLKALLGAIDGCTRLKFVRSTLISNEEWKAHGEKALPKVIRS